MTESLDTLAGALRAHDHDRYLTTLFAPAERREGLLALYAFNLEIAKTAELVTETMIGRIRLQWWYDGLEEIYAGRGRAHYVLSPLARLVGKTGLPQAPFQRLIAAREFDLERQPPSSMMELGSYLDGTSSALVELALATLGEEGDQARHIATHVGQAYGLIGLVRAIPSHAAQGRLYLPEEVMAEVGLDRHRVFALEPSPALSQAAERLCGLAAQSLEELRASTGLRTGKAALPALLPAVLAGRYLRDLRKAGFDPFHPSLRQPRPGRLLALIWAYLKGRV